MTIAQVTEAGSILLLANKLGAVDIDPDVVKYMMNAAVEKIAKESIEN